MGMYTELCCDFKLKSNTPAGVIEALKFMADMDSIFKDEEVMQQVFPNAKIFYCERSNILKANCVGIDSDHTYGNFSVPYTNFYYDDKSRQWVLKCISNFKDYDDNIKYFFEWVAPFVDYENQKAIGYSLDENYDSIPLYYKIKNSGNIETYA